MIEASLRSPADIERTGDVGAGPVEDIHYLVPIGHLLIIHGLHRRTCDNHTVELLMAHRLKVAIEHHHVFYGRILRRMTLKLHKIDIQLQRGVR